MVRPSRSPGASDQVPLPLSVPADNVEPTGTSAMVMVKISDWSLRAASIVNAMAVSSAPVAFCADRVGVSACGATDTDITSETDATDEPSIELAVTVRSNDPLKLFGGVIVNPESSAGVRVTVPSGLTVPADRTDPAGISLTSTESISSGFDSVAEISSTKAVSSSPDASLTDTVSGSATGVKVTGMTWETDVVSLPSTTVTDTSRSKVPL